MAVRDDLDRGSGRLEKAFFAGENAPLLEELRKRCEETQRREILRDVVKLQDEAFITRLDTLGIRPETALAVLLVPLVLVAWADGELGDRERAALLAAAEQRGVTAADITRQLLTNGLRRRPDPKLLSLWKACVRPLWGCFTTDERWQMRQNLLQSAREVAEAAGGFLGLTSKISAEERRVLEDLERVLD